MKKQSIFSKVSGKTFFYIVTIGYAIIALFPFAWSIYTSLRPTTEAFKMNLDFSNLSLDSYKEMLTNLPILRWYFNSTVVAVAVTLLSVMVNSMAGYALARIKFPGRNVMFFVIVGVMMIPAQITMIPTYMILSKMELVNTYTGLIIPFIFSAFNVYMMRQFFLSLPVSLEEAAELDGMTRLQIFFKIALPLARPALTTITIMTFMGSWNNFLFPNLLTTEQDMYTLTVGMASLNNQYYSFPNQTMAGAMFLSIPMILFFLVFQRFFIEGAANTGGKE
ncbi:MAG: carbohydrate ABC transporter permease [Bacillaceae bacterium]